MEEMLKDVAEEVRRELDDGELDLEKIVAKAYDREEARRVAVPSGFWATAQRTTNKGRRMILGGGPARDGAQGAGRVQQKVGGLPDRKEFERGALGAPEL